MHGEVLKCIGAAWKRQNTHRKKETKLKLKSNILMLKVNLGITICTVRKFD